MVHDSQAEAAVVLQQLLNIEERKWQYEFIPVPTDRCDRCVERTEGGKQPSCVKHCQAGCMYAGTLSDLVSLMTDDKYVLFA